MLSALSENQQTISCIYLVPSEIQIQVVCVTIALLCMYTTICDYNRKYIFLSSTKEELVFLVKQYSKYLLHMYNSCQYSKCLQ